MYGFLGDGTMGNYVGNPEDYAGDKAKLDLKIAEFALHTKGCTGPVDGVCPTREKMNNSLTRRAAVKGIRDLLSFFRKK